MNLQHPVTTAEQPRSWNDERSELSHDRYKNRLHFRLSRLERECLTPAARDSASLRSAVAVLCEGIQDDIAVGVALMDRFESEMSPKAVVHGPLFDGMASEYQEPLGEFVDRLWRQRYRVERGLGLSGMNLRRVRAARAQLAQEVNTSRPPVDLIRCGKLLRRLRRAFSAMVGRIDALPRGRVPL